MDSEISFTVTSPPICDGINYQMWVVKMEAYLDANDLWEAVEVDYEVLPLPKNPIVSQMKHHKERRLRKSKAKSVLFMVVYSVIFNRIMTMKTAYEIWNFLKQEYEGSERKGMQALNVVREFKMQKMKDSETIKDYADKLIGIANKIWLLGTDLSDSRIIQKTLVTIPEKYEATITSLENSKDLSNITLAELMSSLHARKQRRLMREEGSIEGALQAKLMKKKNIFEGNLSACPHCKKTNNSQYKCWRRPDIKCNKCGQMKSY